MENVVDRYHRQSLLAGFGPEAQRRLGASTALILGCGALGCTSSELLARAGVGHLKIVDRDFVELTNLQRQTLYDEDDARDAAPKAVAAARRLGRINSAIEITPIVDDINHTNIASLADGADIIVDGLDNLETRYLANDLAVRRGLPFVYGAAVGTSGMAFTILPHGDGNAPWERDPSGNLATPCFRCLFEELPPPGSGPTCDTVGVLGPVVTTIGSHQVSEALKVLTGNYARIRRTLLSIDLWWNESHSLGVERVREHGDCPCCKGRRFEFLAGEIGSSATVLCGRNAVQVRQRLTPEALDFGALSIRLGEHGRVTSNEYLLRAHITDSDKDYELTLFRDGRAIIKGTDQPETARGLYARFIGS
jgi:adenylyltransferase/sulfurtransferase